MVALAESSSIERTCIFLEFQGLSSQEMIIYVVVDVASFP